MAIVQNFTAGQVYGLPSEIVLTDSSTGTDVTITKRRIYVTDKDGTAIVEDGTVTAYAEWDDFPATTTKTLNLFSHDKAVFIRVDWLTAGNSVVQTKTSLAQFPLYAKTYYIFLTKAQSSNEKLKDNANFYQNYIKLELSIKEAETSVLSLNDISSAQAALNRARKLIDNPQHFF